MYAIPDVDAVGAVAKAPGIHLGPEEAVLYRKYLLEQLQAFDTIVRARMEEPQPPMVSAARKTGYRPRPEEDPLNAWMWKCQIEGVAAGLLAGKTVSYKDYIAVAGMPMRFGSFALEGFIPVFDAAVVTQAPQAGGTISCLSSRGCPVSRGRRLCARQGVVAHTPREETPPENCTQSLRMER